MRRNLDKAGFITMRGILHVMDIAASIKILLEVRKHLFVCLFGWLVGWLLFYLLLVCLGSVVCCSLLVTD